MAAPPSITLNTSNLPASSSSKCPPWNALGASTSANKRRAPPTALQTSPDRLSPPRSRLEEETSLVGDYGDNKHLEQLNWLTRRHSVSPTGDDPLVQVGAGFSTGTHASGLDVSDTRSTGGDSISLRSNVEPSSTLSDLIREKSQDAVSAERRTFYAISDLQEVVTPATARQELGDIPDLDAILDQIFVPRTVSNHKTRIFKIFVIVTLMGKSEAIREFIDDEIYDLDLPFERTTAEGPSKNRDQYLRNRQIPGRRHSEVGMFKRWAKVDIESFMEKQHTVCVPIFDLDTQRGAPVSHYNLHGQTILPFIENEAHSARSEGRSDVWRVKIHPGHTICKAHGTNTSLAVKHLKYRAGTASSEESENFFNKEAKNLRRFASRDHEFIIKLLCTFQWRNDYYFLFPWADGNLYDFWSRHPTPLAPLKQPSTARWLSTQCLGLATALRDIHRGDAHSKLHLNPQQKNHGKHGDIKPENILYFNTDSKEDDLANGACLVHLKISDLGEAEFHSTTSMQVDAMSVRHTPSYSAPELRVKNISMPTYDIFSLACVLLEFVTWYLHGFDEVTKFHEKRLREQEAPVYNFHGDFKVDGFFKHVEVHVDESRHSGAMHKSSVSQEIVRLCEDEYCSDYILDLLVFIKDHLLRMNPKNRADCDTIYKKFQELDRLCLEDDRYCVKKLQQAPARSRTDRSLITDIDIEFPEGHKIEMMTGSKSGWSAEYQIKLVKKLEVDINRSHAPRGSLPTTPVPICPPKSPQTNLPRQLTPIEEAQVGPGVNSSQEHPVSQHDTTEAPDAPENTSNRKETLSSTNPSQPSKASDNGRGADLLPIPGRNHGASSSAGSTNPGEDINTSDDGGQSSMRSAKRIFRRMPSEKDRGDRGPHGAKAKVVRFLRRAFC